MIFQASCPEEQSFFSSPAVQSQRCAKLASWHLRTEAVFDPAWETRLAFPDEKESTSKAPEGLTQRLFNSGRPGQ